MLKKVRTTGIILLLGVSPYVGGMIPHLLLKQTTAEMIPVLVAIACTQSQKVHQQLFRPRPFDNSKRHPLLHPPQTNYSENSEN